MAQDQMIRSFYDAVNSRDFEKFTSFFSDDGKFKDMSSDRVFSGKKEIREMADAWMKAISDVKLQVLNVIGSGDDYSVELALTGTHDGTLSTPMGDFPASGKKVDVPSSDRIHLKNGKIQWLNCYFAAPVLLSQIGAMQSKKAA